MSEWHRVHRSKAFPAEWDIRDFWAVACLKRPGGANDHMVASPGGTLRAADDRWRVRFAADEPSRCPFSDCGQKVR